MQSKAHSSTGRAGVRGVLALVLVACLVECATGSCLSYGHSCWGAHGKRSGKPPATAPDWYLTRILRRMVANSELNRAKQLASQNEDAIYRVEEDTPATNRLMSDSEEAPLEPSSKGLEAKPMIDDDVLSKMKLWQIMRAASDEK
ncbi:neuropeptide CCHamide-1 isoform X2 [Bicyclus anynana]|uniref:Neuropeptide CCHamide-1 isoform X2 n=1 Tax=Bicyclus anynana TaxID=110368 RepID=A0ABM3LLD8_BICAN|nr:neuropeptide CCHamide-1 isoform X2 [Bicyclus anynana]